MRSIFFFLFLFPPSSTSSCPVFPIFSPQYTGGTEYSLGLKFIQDEYFARNLDESRTIYAHVTDATNTENVAFVWKATKHIILEQNLTRSGLLMC